MAAAGRSGTGVGFEASALSAYVSRLESTLSADAQRRIMRAAGNAAKGAALSAAEDTLGNDRAMSNFKRGTVKLGAGYDTAGWELTINHRPKGLWMLAERGRSSSGPIYPRRSNRRSRVPVKGRAVMTPQGPRSSSSYRPSRGLRTFSIAAGRERTEGTKAAWRQLQSELRRVVRR